MSTDLFSSLGVAATIGDDSLTPKPLTYKAAARRDELEIGTNVWESYAPTIEIKGARRHPSPLVESAALAAIAPPAMKMRPLVAPALLARGILSNEQLEAVTMIADAHERPVWLTRPRPVYNPAKDSDEDRNVPVRVAGGFLLADGTGTGKTRTLCAVIHDQMAQGNDRHVYLTLKSSLVDGFRSAWEETLGDPEAVREWTNKVAFNHGVLFSSYATLVKRGLDAFLALLGAKDANGEVPSFTGVIVIDEAHAGANAEPVSSATGLSGSTSQRGELIVELQDLLPNARFVYVSATSAQRPDALAYAARLGLYGPNNEAFPTHRAFVKEIASQTAALEATAHALKASGRMIARTLSFDGVDYEALTVTPTAQDIEDYNSASKLMYMLHTRMVDAYVRAGVTDASRETKGDVKRSPYRKSLTSIEQFEREFFSQLFRKIQAPTVAGRIRKALQAGERVAIQIVHTGAAALERALDARDKNDPDALETLDLSCRAHLQALVKANFPIYRYRKQLRSVEKNEKIYEWVVVTDGAGKPVVDPAMVAERDQLISELDNVALPHYGTYLWRDAFPDLVGEITGNTWMLERNTEGKRTLRRRRANENEADKHAFHNGTKPIIVFSEGAGGVGIDLHASTQHPCQSRITHIVEELSDSATALMQAFGRTHRTGQVVPPRIVMVSTTIPAQARLRARPARQIAQLGALSHGERTASSNGIFSAEDHLETSYGTAALARLVADVQEGIAPMSLGDWKDELAIDLTRTKVTKEATSLAEAFKQNGSLTIRRFLTRLMALPIAEDGGRQGVYLGALRERLDLIVKSEIAAGRYDGGIVSWPVHTAVALSRERLHLSADGVATDLVHVKIGQLPDDRITWSRIVENRRLVAARNCTLRFVRLPEGTIGAYVPERASDTSVSVATPAGMTVKALARVRACDVVDDADAEAEWAWHYNALPVTYRDAYLAVGNPLGIWSKLGPIVTIARLRLSDGTLLVGRIVAADYVEDVRAAFGLAAIAA
jgi:hypothetical protein